MNFEFSDEQNMLREQAQTFLNAECPPQAVRAVLDGDAPYDEGLWQKVVEMGWTATVIPEAYDGLGLSYLELSVIAEELGRSMAPIPFSSSVYFATEALLLAGSETQKHEWLPKLARGEVIGCLADAESGGQLTAAGLTSRYADGRLTGRKIPVADGDVAGLAVVVAGSDQGPVMVLVDLNQSGCQRQAIKTLDPSRSHAEVIFEGAEATLLGEAGDGWNLLQQLYNRAAVLFAWEQVGGAETALSMAKDYALNRFAFGRPIATYQAIKHKLAQAYVKNTLARGNCYYGAWALDTSADELPLAAASARVSAIQAYYYASKENIQTHGGMGFTWEFDCQFPYRRSKLLAVNIGSEAIWQEKLIAAIEAERAA
ncbi:MAG: acyl-CoA/acyl-ACP dehydrogenase [Pseudomonadales bacterium]|jgi:acyl-CoA dehydrogenase|nr:acyl-CoA/acyl-ACP dehydrogenase [Pseudomonadales bacterium]MDA0760201.1 acyl-CoA/acyl-ACP dehydrogenase [Pseudomonadota bacterium]MDA0956695.1 acyl-CoA/acyl-ACP dehydrogenase [Pseudomonadota bacterium]